MLREELSGIVRREHKLERRAAVYDGIHLGVYRPAGFSGLGVGLAAGA